MSKSIIPYMDRTIFEKRWIDDMTTLIMKRYPDSDPGFVTVFLINELDLNLRKETLMLKDTYRNRLYESDTLAMTQYLEIKKPLMAGNGVLMDRDGKNPAVDLLHKFKKVRKFYKNRLLTEDEEGSYEYMMDDLKQSNEKVKMNAWYGMSGAGSALFFNLECASGTTIKGRQLISTATCAFDYFLGSNVIFLSMDECYVYIKNCLQEKRKYRDEDWLDDQNKITVEMVVNRLVSFFDDKYDCKYDDLEAMISNCSQKELNKIYYKNNLEAFCLNKKVKAMIEDFCTCIEVYVNPADDKTPDFLKEKLNRFWDLLEDFVYYNYEAFDKVYKVNRKQRKRVLTIDTDSNMVHMEPWIHFVRDNILPERFVNQQDNTNDLVYVVLYTMCYILSKMIRTALWRYLGNCNVKESIRSILDMKNEFLFLRMIITQVKKNYASVIKYKEGKDMKGKLDTKGLPIYKSSTNRVAADVFKNILEYDILKSEKIDIAKVLIKIEKFESEIRRSLRNGEQTYLKPSGLVKEEEAYDDPLSVGPLRAAMMWNLLYPEEELVLPETFYLVKMNLLKEHQLADVKDEYIRETLRENIFNNPDKRIRSKGCYLMGIPKTSKIPEWARPFVDENQIVEDTVKSFMGIIKALGPEQVYMNAGSEQISNIIGL